MTLRQNILDNLYNGLQNITVSNGYDNTVVGVHKNLINTSTINSYPVLSIQLGSEVLQGQIEGYQEGLYTLDVVILGYVQTNDVTTSVESLISDLKRYFNKDENLSFSVVSNLLDIEYIQGYDIKETNPYLAYTNNIASFGLLLKIEYIDWYNPATEIVLSAPVLSSPVNNYSEGSLFQALNWNSVTDAQLYHIRVYDNNDVLVIDQDNLINTSFTIPDDISFADGDTIKWQVRAKTGNIFSDWSNQWSYTINDTSIIPLNPNQISNNNLWLRSDLGITLTSSRVSTWADQSSGGSNFTQATSTRRPVLFANAYNGIQSVYFNPNWAGAGETLSYNDSTLKYDWTDVSQGSFMFTFMSDGTKFATSDGYFVPFTRSNTNYGSQWAFTRGVNTGPMGYHLAYPNFNAECVQIPFSLNIPHQVIVVKNGTNHITYLDGHKISEITRTPLSFPNQVGSYVNIGSMYNTGDANGKFTGHFFETAFWTKTLTTDEVKSLYQYHKDYFGL
ncbi:MAG: hypothetical protein IAE93_12955 [Ignavibacteria bacterium]|nr:hypothetical protein [Ignavibacteria bacterium]